jgi:hypothetical protein
VDGPAVVDLHDPTGKKGLAKAGKEAKDEVPPTKPAWHGTLLPKADADVWLTSAFAGYERLVALEAALKKRGKGKLTEKDRDRLKVALFGYRAMYELGSRARPEVPLARTKSDLRQDDWYHVALGKGALLLHGLRGLMGDEKFVKAMDAFGRAHAGEEVTAAQFQAHVEKAAGKKLETFFKPWLTEKGIPASPISKGPFSVLTFYPEVEDALIVYGTGDELATNRESALALQQALRKRGANVTVPVKRDRDVSAADLKGHHLLLIGRPDTNSVVERFRASLPVAFGRRSFTVRGKAYAHAGSAVLAAAENPCNKRFSVVVIAGLGPASTLRAAPALGRHSLPAGEVVVLAHGKRPHALVVPPKELVREAAREAAPRK